jgi:hypothetical protein
MPRLTIIADDDSRGGIRDARIEVDAEARMSNPAEALPGPCQEDLELLRDSIRELAGGHPGGPPVPADRFGAVFLTGATGFVGRFVLSELLRQNDHMLIHCLVRAGNAKLALVRVQAALESAGLSGTTTWPTASGPGQATCASRGSAWRSWTSGGCATRSTRSTT